MMPGRSKKPRLQERVIAALLSEPTQAAAATAAGVSEATLSRWLQDPAFRAAYDQARRDVLQTAVDRLQAATGDAVETLVTVAKTGAKDSDRVKAAALILDHAFRGLNLHNGKGVAAVDGTADVVRVLAERLRQLDAANLPMPAKARLTAALADSLLRAIGVDVLDKRLEALQSVLLNREAAK
jgi:hypothetical protein